MQGTAFRTRGEHTDVMHSVLQEQEWNVLDKLLRINIQVIKETFQWEEGQGVRDFQTQNNR